MFIDTHAHLNDDRLYVRLDEVIKDAEAEGVQKIICASYDLQSSMRAVEIANKYKNVYATIGFHPHDAKDYTGEAEKEFLNLAKDKKVIAFGEVGLDYHYSLSPHNVQREVFIKQLALADKLKLPVVIHERDAAEDVLKILKENKHLLKHGGVMHCFGGNSEKLKEVLGLGLVISVGGIVTFKNSNMDEMLLNAGLDNIMLETDCPYLAPVPYRGKDNEPKYIPFVAKKLCDIFKCSLTEVEEKTTRVAERVFKI